MSGQRVGVVGGKRLSETVEALGHDPVTESSEFENVSFVVVRGEPALSELVQSTIDVPVLILDADGGVPSIPIDRLEDGIEGVIEEAAKTVQLPVVAAATSSDTVRSVFDVALMADEPARISEFSVRSRDVQVSRFRADGVVASTPAGSVGYNRSAGGPIVAPETGVASVVPIAPFATAVGHWILPIDSVRLRVERDETPVELLADGRRAFTVGAGELITLSRVDTVKICVLPCENGPFEKLLSGEESS